jgi:hypothetical protein
MIASTIRDRHGDGRNIIDRIEYEIASDQPMATDLACGKVASNV